MSKSFKQEAYDHYKEELKTYADAVVIGYDSKNNVIDVAKNPKELGTLMKNSNTKCVAYNQEDSMFTGYDFRDNKQFIKVDNVYGEPSGIYSEELFEKVLQNSSNPQEIVKENDELFVRLEEFCNQNGKPYNSTKRSIEDSTGEIHQVRDISINVGQVSIDINNQSSLISIKGTASFLVIHSPERDVELDWYATTLAKLIGTDYSSIENIFAPTVQV
ncbi:hypothetical protein COF68_06115 [Bacillus toyonensis]|uniref:hypothetical protein n=1 Tax=Bacillus toyonensis TaxID=155322 RepID=UPI000BFCAA64|nr:hypothetical protein [Bacillus toyonensis]PHE64409.1 hypothetical protein COF68_06115 [Bacillus toyonensis]